MATNSQFGLNVTGQTVPATGYSTEVILAADVYGSLNRSGKGYMLVNGPNVAITTICNGVTATSTPITRESNRHWASINVPANTTVTYKLSSITGIQYTGTQVESFFEPSSPVTVASYGTNDINLEYVSSGVREYRVNNTTTGFVTFAVNELMYPAASAVFTNEGRVIDTGLYAFNNTYNAELASNGYGVPTLKTANQVLGTLFVEAGTVTTIRVLAPLNLSTIALSSSFEAPSVANLSAAFPDIANSLTLHPAGSAEMLDAGNRAEEAFYADRARAGEFGYSVRRRLYHMGYNV